MRYVITKSSRSRYAVRDVFGKVYGVYSVKVDAVIRLSVLRSAT